MSLYTYRFVCTRVVDGDTVDGRIDLGFRLGMDTRVRLAGYDAPETWRPASVQEGEAGALVTEYLAQLLEGKELLLQSQKLDLYNRSIGELLADGESVNAAVMGFIKENQLEKARFRP
jgi:endonuclease YncB( thermonuclease family)